ncbi:MAG: hypothetical protein KF892_23565 [Rhizobacter sp.]|nr:hypothetical protein [Rhizobacter sp.]
MRTGANFGFTRIVIVESLESHEVKTGTEIANYIRGLEGAQRLNIPIEVQSCESAYQFKGLVASLAEEARSKGNYPLLHVECHGDDKAGLEFENGSLLSWEDLSTSLVELNKATRFNLMAIFSACYGAYFLSKLSSVEPAPCYAMLAPTEEIFPFEILDTLREFYRVLFLRSDAGVAVDVAMRKELESGRWLAQQSELWYERVSIGYIETHCTRAEMKARARRMYERLPGNGPRPPLSDLKRELQRLNRESLLGKFFERYFMTQDIPENIQRFRAAKLRMEQRIVQLRSTGRYGI